MEGVQENWQGRLAALVEQLKESLQTVELEGLDPELRSKYFLQFDQLARRIADPCLRISVIGEFSAGKSAFINALVREKIVKSSNLPTTAAATFISKGQNDVVVHFSSDREPLRYSSTVASVQINKGFRDFIRRYQTNEYGESADVLKIEVTLNRNILDNDAFIVDTPGFNAGDHIHEAILEKVLSKESDVGVILFNAVDYGRQSDLEFIERFKDQIHKMFFVLNKADRVEDQSTIPEIVCQLQRKIKNHFGMDQTPAVYPLTSRFNPNDPKDEHHLQVFQSFERQLLDFARIEKLFVILNPITRLLDSLILNILDHVAAQEAILRSDKEKIEQIRIEDPETFISREHKQANKWLRQAFSEVKDRLTEMVGRIFETAHIEIKAILDAHDFINPQSLGPKINKELDVLEKGILEILSKRYVTLFGDSTKDAIERFRSNFHRYYETLNKKLDIEIRIEDVIESNVPEMPDLKSISKGLAVKILSNFSAIQKGWINSLLNLMDSGRKKRELSQKIMTDLGVQLSSHEGEVLQDVELMTKRLKKEVEKRVIYPVVQQYAEAYVATIKTIIFKNDCKCRELQERLNRVLEVHQKLETVKRTLEIEEKDSACLQRYIMDITGGSFGRGEQVWDDIDTVRYLIERYGYRDSIKHIYESMDPVLLPPIYSYLWGCLGTLLNRDPGEHYIRFLNTVFFARDNEMLGRTIDHLEKNDFTGIERIYPFLDYARSDSSLAAKLYDVFLRHERPKISVEIHANHCLKLLVDLHTHTKRLLDQCNRMPI
jgi:GTP-binding protein EngB required for normal cell division